MKGAFVFVLALACVLQATAFNRDVLSNLLERLLDEKYEKKGHAKRVAFPTDCGINKFGNKPPKSRSLRENEDEASILDVLRSLLGNKQEKRIMGGNQAAQGAHPWIVYFNIPQGDGHAAGCGGSLITPQWVVTAAHCFFDSKNHQSLAGNKDKIIVVVGEHNIKQGVHEKNEKELTIEEIFTHEEYDPSVTVTSNDIALVRLTKPVQLNEYVRVICMPEKPIAPKSKCQAAGWGIQANGKAPDILREVNLVSMSQEACDQTKDFKLVKGMMCAGKTEKAEKGDACEGDSGGPLACLVDGKYTLGGATSFGVDCRTSEISPGIYADVFSYKQWIEEIISVFDKK